MNRKRLIFLLFCGSVFLTLFVNYRGFSRASKQPNSSRQFPIHEQVHRVVDDNGSSRSKFNTTAILSYRKYHPSGSTTGQSSTGAGESSPAPIPIVSMNESLDDEMILNHPLSLPHRNNSINCTSSVEHALETRTITRASFTIVVNFVPGSIIVKCDESVTYTTHGDFRFLDNLVPLVERWVGPVSIALYAPLGDLQPTIDAIIYMRECTTPLIKEWVSFHVFGDTRFFIDPMPYLAEILSAGSRREELCSNVPKFGDDIPNMRTAKRLLYPVNVARNVARQAAMTLYVLASDIELYPSVDMVPMFMDMIFRNQSKALHRSAPRVFSVPVFEIKDTAEIPDNKAELLELIKKRDAVSFHRKICSPCHRIPQYFQWLRSKTLLDEQLDVFHVTKRLDRFRRWEPIFIGTNNEPLFDERLSWEGLRDKMTQNYILCVLDYDYMILDNAFLVHKPGIKVKKHPKKPDRAIRKQNRIFKKISNELNNLYGKRAGCEL